MGRPGRRFPEFSIALAEGACPESGSSWVQTAHFMHAEDIRLVGSPWCAHLSAEVGVLPSNTDAPELILLFGLGLSGLLAFFLRAQVKARESAERMSNRLGESEQRLRMLFDQSPLAVLVTGPDLAIRNCNGQFERMFGLSTGAIRGGRLSRLGHPKIEQVIEEAAAGREESYEGPLENPAGPPRWVRITAAPLRDPSGEPAGCIAVLEDITERWNTERSLRQRTDELEIINRVTIDRELRMVELKAEISRLTARLDECSRTRRE